MPTRVILTLGTSSLRLETAKNLQLREHDRLLEVNGSW